MGKGQAGGWCLLVCLSALLCAPASAPLRCSPSSCLIQSRVAVEYECAAASIRLLSCGVVESSRVEWSGCGLARTTRKTNKSKAQPRRCHGTSLCLRRGESADTVTVTPRVTDTEHSEAKSALRDEGSIWYDTGSKRREATSGECSGRLGEQATEASAVAHCDGHRDSRHSQPRRCISFVRSLSPRG